jgi:replication factor C large subunit
MLLEKYEPEHLQDFIGARQQIADIKRWLASWKHGNSLMIFGPTGVGKSLAVKLIAKDMGYELIESHASDDRTQNGFSDLIKSTKQHCLTLRKKITLIDEIDMLDSTKPINEIISVSAFPVILIASDPYNKKLYNIRKRSKLVKFDKISSDDMAKFLVHVCEKEGIEYDKNNLVQLARISNGDMRSALLDLELFGKMPAEFFGQREQKSDIFDILKVIMKTKNMDNARTAMKNCKDIEELITWIAENVSEEYSGEDLAAAYDYLSHADLFYSRIIRRQSWGLQKYFFDLSVLGTAISKKSASTRFVMYKVPRFYYSENKELLRKIGKSLHTSSKKSAVYIPIIKKELKSVSKKFHFDEDDIETIKAL